MDMRPNKKNKRILSSDAEASFSLIIARIVYGINWFNISAIFPLIALEFNKDVSLLGSISAALAGIGLMQIPAGIFKASAIHVFCIVGIIISSTCSTLWVSILLVTANLATLHSRKFGMAFFFSSI